jgi:polyhydroxybutyrate depolymerase
MPSAAAGVHTGGSAIGDTRVFGRRRSWPLVAAALLSTLFLTAPATSSASDPGWTTVSRQIAVEGRIRTYLLARPTSDADMSLPVIVALHGRAMTPATMQHVSGLQHAIGPAIFVYPEGHGLSWNAGSCCGPALTARMDDVSFLRSLVHHVVSTEPGADPQRVRLVGYSNGGRMAFRLACADPGTFSAVAAVEAAPVWTCPSLGSPVSLQSITSARDPVVSKPALDSAMRTWSSLDGCAPTPSAVATNGMTVRRWTGCRGGSELQQVDLPGGSHAWPRGGNGLPSATNMIATFFRAAAAVSPAGP